METVVSRFEEIARRYPYAIALEAGNERVTYGDLNHQANRIADMILARAGAENEPVALIFTHSYRLVAATLGTLKARKIYAAINPFLHTRDWGHRGSLEKDKIRGFVRALKPCLVLCDHDNWNLAHETCDTVRVINVDLPKSSAYEKNPGIKILPTDKSVILHTSGTTGEPKAIVRDHEFEAYNQEELNQPPAQHGDRTTIFRSAGFGGFHDLMFAIRNGATMCLFDLKNKEILSDWAESITYWRSVGTVFRMLDLRSYPNMRVVNIGGEPIQQKDWQKFDKQFPGATFIDRYASSETGPITNNGRALGDRMIMVAADTGEIVVYSKHLALGYFGNEELTKTKFRSNGNGWRSYRTGDRGYFKDDILVHCGRIMPPMMDDGNCV